MGEQELSLEADSAGVEDRKDGLGLPHLHALLPSHRPPSPPDFRHTSVSDRKGAKSRSPSTPSSHIRLLFCGAAESTAGLSPPHPPTLKPGPAQLWEHKLRPTQPRLAIQSCWHTGAPLQWPLAAPLGVCTESREGPLTSLGWRRTLPGGEDSGGAMKVCVERVQERKRCVKTRREAGEA